MIRKPDPKMETPGTMTHPKDEETDQQIVARVLAGEPKAYDRLLARIEPDLRNYLRGQIRTRPELAVDEVLQDVRIYLYQRLDRYNPAYPLAVFARGLGKNVAKRHLFKRSDLAPAPWEDQEDGESEGWEEVVPQDLESLPRAFRDVLGEGRFESPEGPPPPSRLFLEILEAFLRYGGYPHQQVAFGYSILLWGKRKEDPSGKTGASPDLIKVPITGDPDRVVTEVGPRQLGESSEEMLGELEASLHLDREFLGRVRKPLDVRLEMTTESLFARDKASQQTFVRLLGMVVHLTMLREYFGKDPRKSVADWTHGVKERVKKAVIDPASQNRNPLPAI